MGATRYEIHEDTFIVLAELMKAIAHPARLKAVLLIANQTEKEITTQEILAQSELAKSTMYQHLQRLRNTGFADTRVITRNQDKKSCLQYRINKLALGDLRRLIRHLSAKARLKDKKRSRFPESFYSKFNPVSNWKWCFSP